MQKPGVVVFDLGKVLLDFDYARLARNMQEHCDVSVAELISAMNQSPLLHRYETGLLTSQAFFEEVKRVSGFREDYDKFEPLFADIFTPIQEMIDLQQRLRQGGTPTCIFSNTNEIAVKHIRERFPFFSTFNDYVFSYEHRAMKPDPRIYEVVERVTGHRGAALLYIDDRPENIDHGRERGWEVIQHVESKQTIKLVEGLMNVALAA
jgi:glucose-1-phosphatase